MTSHDSIISMSITNTIKKIDPEREYNLSNIITDAIFPWARDIRTVRKIVMRDHGGEKVLRAKITGSGRSLEYRIKGENIIKFLEKYGPGFTLSVAKNK